MDEAEFHMVTQQLLMLGNLVKDIKLADYITAISRADSIGPIVDPTLWRKGHQKTAILQKMARGLIEFQESLPTEEEAKQADLAAQW